MARNEHFISDLIESGIEFEAVDCPHGTRLMLHIAALAAAKARGAKLGGYRG